MGREDNWSDDPEGRLAALDESFSNEADTPLPDAALFARSALYDRLIVMPMMRPAVTKGGIIVPTFTHNKDEHLTHFGRLAAIGTLAFKNIKYERMKAMPEDFPAIGDWLAYSPYAVIARYRYKSTKLVVMKDEAPFLRLPAGTDPWDFEVIY